MFTLEINATDCRRVKAVPLVSGSQNIYSVEYIFSPEWDELEKTAVFFAGRTKVSALLDKQNCCVIPWEVLQYPRKNLLAGVCGTLDGEVIMPTVWANLGEIQLGATPGEMSEDPPTDVYGQILSEARKAVRTAEKVQADADAGKFDGADYVLTDEDKREIAEQVGLSGYVDGLVKALADKILLLEKRLEALEGGGAKLLDSNGNTLVDANGNNLTLKTTV